MGGANQIVWQSRANIETPQHKLQKVLSWRTQFPKTQLPPAPIHGAHCPVQQVALLSPPGKHLCRPHQRRSCLQNLLLRCMRCCNLGHSVSGLVPLRELSKAALHSRRFFPNQSRDPFSSQHTSLAWWEDRQGRDVAQHNQSHRSLSAKQCHSCWFLSCILDGRPHPKPTSSAHAPSACHSQSVSACLSRKKPSDWRWIHGSSELRLARLLVNRRSTLRHNQATCHSPGEVSIAREFHHQQSCCRQQFSPSPCDHSGWRLLISLVMVLLWSSLLSLLLVEEVEVLLPAVV